MSLFEPAAEPPPYKNRRPGLIGCGIVWLLFGIALVAMCALMIVGFFLAPQGAAKAQLPQGMMIVLPLMYAAMAAVFLALGIGSIMARRWAPPLIVILSVAWLIMGILGGGAMLFFFPQAFAILPPDQRQAVAGCMALMFAIMGVLVPALFLFFYRSKHVKATVEQLDPIPRWTDRYPVPLLGFALWMFAGAASMFFSLSYPAMPIGTIILRGWPMYLVNLVIAATLIWIGIGALRRQRAAWWAALGFLVLAVVYCVAFLNKIDYARWYEAMELPVDRHQMEMMQAMYSSPFFYVWLALFWGMYLAFLLYLRRWFFGPRSEGPAVQPPVDLQ